jgi:hypothetical protein
VVLISKSMAENGIHVERRGSYPTDLTPRVNLLETGEAW